MGVGVAEGVGSDLLLPLLAHTRTHAHTPPSPHTIQGIRQSFSVLSIFYLVLLLPDLLPGCHIPSLIEIPGGCCLYALLLTQVVSLLLAWRGSSEWEIFFLSLGDMCCAQFTIDNQWYRACIKTAYSPAQPNVVPTLENNLCVEVQYIDYGNSEWLPLSRWIWSFIS